MYTCGWLGCIGSVTILLANFNKETIRENLLQLYKIYLYFKSMSKGPLRLLPYDVFFGVVLTLWYISTFLYGQPEHKHG